MARAEIGALRTAHTTALTFFMTTGADTMNCAMSHGTANNRSSSRRRESARLADRMPAPLWSILLFALVLVVFSPALLNGFIALDDPAYVVTNPYVQAGLRWQGLLWGLGGHVANWHPLTWVSHMLDCQVFGLRAWGHHLTNVLFHAFNSLLLFLVLDRMTGRLWRSLFVAALFALHPLHVESVAWIAERKDVLSTFFWLLTLLTYTIWTQRSSVLQAGAKTFYLLSVVAFSLGLMSKSMLVTTPFLLLLLDYWPLRRISKPGWKGIRPVIIEKVPFFCLSAVSAVVTFLVQRNGGAVGSLTRIPVVPRIENTFISFVRYLEKLFWPRDLSIYYPHPWGAWPAWQVNSACVFIAGISVIVLVIRKKYPPAFVGWFWFVGTLVPVIGIIQVGTQTMADRYTYFPAIGIFILVVWSCSDFARGRPGGRWLLGAAGAAIVLCCATLTIRQLGYWRDSEQLFQHAAAAGYDCSFVEVYLAAGLSSRGANEEALAHMRRAERLNPTDGYTRMHVSIYLDRTGHTEEALTKVQEAIRLSPTLPKAYFIEGLLLEKLDQSKQALAAYEKAVELDQLHELQFARYNSGVLLDKFGRTEEAIHRYRAELKVNPRYAEAYNNLGKALLAEHRLDEAAAQFQSAIRIRPDFAEAHNNLGGAFYFADKKADAAAEFRKALRLRPDYEDAKKNLDNLVHGNGSK